MAKKRKNEDFIKIVKEKGNGEYLALEKYKGANEKIMFKHLKCGFEYLATPNNFIRGTRCPSCFGNFKKTSNKFKLQLKEKFGDEYELVGNYVNARTKIKIKHNFCGNIGYHRLSELTIPKILSILLVIYLILFISFNNEIKRFSEIIALELGM